MRRVLLLAVSALLAGCSQIPAVKPGPTPLTPISPTHRTSTASPATPPTSVSAPAPPVSPALGAPVATVIGWVEAGPPALAADFQTAFRGGQATTLTDDIAFTTPFGTTCMTDAARDPGGLACLVELINPPSQPADSYGAWKGGWVDFDGAEVRVGSAHADPGRFAVGRGAPLPPGASLSFGDFRCRTDATTLVCVNYAHKTAVRYRDDGINTYGCTRRDPPPPGVGVAYTC